MDIDGLIAGLRSLGHKKHADLIVELKKDRLRDAAQYKAEIRDIESVLSAAEHERNRAIKQREETQSALDDLSKRFTALMQQNSALAAENEVLTAQNAAMNGEIYKRKADLETIHKALLLTKRSVISDSEGLIEWAKQEVVIRQWKDHESEQGDEGMYENFCLQCSGKFVGSKYDRLCGDCLGRCPSYESEQS